MGNKKEKTYWAAGEPARDGDGFVGIYGAPGLSAGMIRDLDGNVTKFPDRDLAELAAWRRMGDVINFLPKLASRHGGKQETYQKPTGPEFANLMADAAVTPTAVAYIFAQKLSKIQEWVSGVDEKGNTTAAPHWTRVLLRIFAKFPESFDFALELTEKYTTNRRPTDARSKRSTDEIDAAN